METLQIILPIAVMLILGFLFRTTGFLTEAGIDNIKKYVTSIALPVTLFHAMASADLNVQTAVIVVCMLVVFSIAMLAGSLLKPLFPAPYKNYLPFLTTIVEGGMFAYPLYQNLCGEAHLANVVVIDIAGCLFAFSFYFGMLALVDQDEAFDAKKLVRDAFRSPSFVGVLLGLLANLTGAMDAFLATPFNGTYLATKNLVTAPLTAMILICVGYGFQLEKKLFLLCLKTALLRLAIMGLLCAAILLLLPSARKDPYMLCAFLVYFVCPPSCALPGFIKNKEAGSYVSVTTSIYILLTLAGYTAITILL